MSDLILFVAGLAGFLILLVGLGAIADWIEPPGSADSIRRNKR